MTRFCTILAACALAMAMGGCGGSSEKLPVAAPPVKPDLGEAGSPAEMDPANDVPRTPDAKPAEAGSAAAPKSDQAPKSEGAGAKDGKSVPIDDRIDDIYEVE